MKKYHVKAGDGKGYYGVGYESYRQAESLLKISQGHDPQAYIVEEEYHSTNADRIRAMSDEELMQFLFNEVSNNTICSFCVPTMRTKCKCDGHCRNGILEWLKQPVKENNSKHFPNGDANKT